MEGSKTLGTSKLAGTAESPPRARASHPALSWNSEADLPLELETVVRPRFPLHTMSRSLICRDVCPSRVQRQVLRVLTALSLLASSSQRLPGAALSWNLETPAGPDRGGGEGAGGQIWGELSQGPPTRKRTERRLEHSRLYLLEILFCLQHASRIAPGRLNFGLVQI